MVPFSVSNCTLTLYPHQLGCEGLQQSLNSDHGKQPHAMNRFVWLILFGILVLGGEFREINLRSLRGDPVTVTGTQTEGSNIR